MINESNENTADYSFNRESDDTFQTSEKTDYAAGFWMRFWAYIIDLIIVSSLNGIIVAPLIFFTNINELTIGIYTIAGFISAVISFGYFIILTKLWRQTLGKRIMGIKVVSVRQEGLSWRDVLMRELVGRYIHQSLVITNILYLIVAFHPDKKGLHDMIADTYVVLERRTK